VFILTITSRFVVVVCLLNKIDRKKKKTKRTTQLMIGLHINGFFQKNKKTNGQGLVVYVVLVVLKKEQKKYT